MQKVPMLGAAWSAGLSAGDATIKAMLSPRSSFRHAKDALTGSMSSEDKEKEKAKKEEQAADAASPASSPDYLTPDQKQQLRTKFGAEKFDKNERMLVTLFQKLNSAHATGLSLQDFSGSLGMIAQACPGSATAGSTKAANLANLLFTAVDADGDGVINIYEWVSWLMLVLHGSAEQRLEWAFKFIDDDHDGILTRAHWSNAMSSLMQVTNKFELVSPGVENQLTSLEKFGLTDKIDVATFKRTLLSNPAASVFLRSGGRNSDATDNSRLSSRKGKTVLPGSDKWDFTLGVMLGLQYCFDSSQGFVNPVGSSGNSSSSVTSTSSSGSNVSTSSTGSSSSSSLGGSAGELNIPAGRRSVTTSFDDESSSSSHSSVASSQSEQQKLADMRREMEDREAMDYPPEPTFSSSPQPGMAGKKKKGGLSIPFIDITGSAASPASPGGLPAGAEPMTPRTANSKAKEREIRTSAMTKRKVVLPTPNKKNKMAIKIFAENAFRAIREADGIKDESFIGSMGLTQMLSSLCLFGELTTLSELVSEGKSGSFFYFSNDARYLVKTINAAEQRVLFGMVHDYKEHIVHNRDTLLVRFYGLYSIAIRTGGSKQTIHFVVMGNIFNTDKKIDQRFDLKGSTLGRTAGVDLNDPKACEGVIFRDLDYISLGRKIQVGPRLANKLKSQIAADTALLQKYGIIDYSLLIGVHKAPQDPLQQRAAWIKSHEAELKELWTHVNVPVGNSTHPGARYFNAIPQERFFEIAHRWTIEGNAADSLLKPQSINAFNYLDGGVPSYRVLPDGREVIGEEVLYLGIIDILIPYELRKQSEHMLKSVVYDGKTVSIVPPNEYTPRFVNFITPTIE